MFVNSIRFQGQVPPKKTETGKPAQQPPEVQQKQGFGIRIEQKLDAAKELSGIFKRSEEVLVSHLLEGAFPLKEYSKLSLDLPPEKQKRIDAYQDLVRAVLRPVGLPPNQETAILKPVLNPSPEMQTLLTQFNVGPEDYEAPIVDSNKFERNNLIDPEVDRRQSKLGLYALKHDTKDGGGGMHLMEYGQMLGLFSSMPANGTRMTATNTIGTDPIKMYGTPAQKAALIPEITAGNTVVFFGLTQAGEVSGTDVDSSPSTAKLSPDGKTWNLRGKWVFITGAPYAKVGYFVTGHTLVNGKDKGHSVFIVPLPFNLQQSMAEKEKHILELHKKGMTMVPIMADGIELTAIRGSGQTYFDLKDFKVPVVYGAEEFGQPIESVLGGEAYIGRGKEIPLNGLNGGRATFPALAAAGAERTAHKAADWVAHRLAFQKLFPHLNRPATLGDFEDIQNTVGEMHGNARALQSLTRFVLALIDGNPSKGIAGVSAMAKAATTDAFVENAGANFELHGGHAFFEGAPDRVASDDQTAKMLRTVEGQNRAMRKLFLQRATDSYLKKLNTLPLMDQMKSLSKVVFSFERGDFPLMEAMWLQSHLRQLTRRIFILERVHGQKQFMQMGNTQLRIAKIYENLVMILASNLELMQDKNKHQLSNADKTYLKLDIKNRKRYVNEQMGHVLFGNPTEKRNVAMGKVALEEARQRVETGEVENPLLTHLAFLDQSATAYIEKLQQRHGGDVSAIDLWMSDVRKLKQREEDGTN